MSTTKAVLLDSSIVRDVTKERKGLNWRRLISAITGCAGEARYRFIVFKDELQSRHIEELRKLFRTPIELFACDLKVFSYSSSRDGYHKRCGDFVRSVKKAFGLREDENCEKEIEKDVFLLIAACAMMNGYAKVIIVTSDEGACWTLRAAVSSPPFSGRIEVLCFEKGGS